MWSSEAARDAGGEPVVRPRRRALLTAALVLPGALAACGFRLRGTQQLPFDSVYIDAPPASKLAVELARSIRSGTATNVLTERAAAQAVLEIASETQERDVLSVNAQGRAREYRLRLRAVVRAHDGQGRELLGPTALSASRDLAVSEEQLLARESEQVQLYADMQIDVAQQVLRRLSTLKR